LILTVRPSSATALASNTCLDHDRDKPTPSNLLCDGPDEWLRWKCKPCELSVKVNGSFTKLNGRKFIKSIDGSCYYELDQNSPNTVTPKSCSFVPGSPSCQELTSSFPDKHVLVKIDKLGTPCAYHWETKVDTQKCSNSCWTSLRPKTS
jgi:hypothetical protein